MARVVLNDLVKSYGNFNAVNHVSLTVEDGEFVALVGPSGCGKTTTLNLVAGLLPITSGDIIIDDHVVNDLDPKDRDIAMVFQNYALYPQKSVYKNLAFPLQMRKLPRDEIDRKVQEAARVLDMTHLLERKPRELSGGQQQRVALGRALVRDPAVFLMDEPLSNLDAKLRVDMRAEIKALQRETGVTTVFVTHDQVEAMTMGDRIAVMRDGLLEQEGRPDVVYNRPANMFVAGFIGSPAMTFGRVGVDRGDGALRLTHPALRLECAPVAGVGDEAIVGIRPEHTRPWQDGAGLAGPFQGTIESVEALGRETFLGVRVADDLRLVVRADGASDHRLGDRFQFGVERGRLHLFHSGSEAAIAHSV